MSLPTTPRTGVARWRTLGSIAAFALAMLVPSDSGAQPLSSLLFNLIGDGVTVDNNFHEAHFANASSRRVAAALNSSLLTQLATSPPVASTSGGFTWEFDPELGTYTQTTDSFGPIYAERPETIGKGKWNFGLSVFRFEYDSIDDIALDNGEFSFDLVHDDSNGDGSTTLSGFEGDLIRERLFLDVTSESTVFFGSWGATDQLDISVAVPVLTVELGGRLERQVNRLASGTVGDSGNPHPLGQDRASVGFGDSASGIGDVIVRGKYRFKDKPSAAVVEVRLPTGDETELLGAGGTQVKLSFIGGTRLGPLSPHINIGYTISSGGGAGGSLGELPNEFGLIAGFEAGLGERVSVAVDLISRTQFDAPRLEKGEEDHFYSRPGGCGEGNATGVTISETERDLSVTQRAVCLTRRQTIRATNRDLNLAYASAGLKIKVSEHLLLTGNLLYSINSNGLRDDGLIPLFGVDYSF